jgi:hypothetical protein
MQRALRYLGYVAAGAAFWVPGILVHLIRGRAFGEPSLDSLAIVTLPVAASILAVELIYRKHQSLSRRGTIALWFLLGVWLLGPLGTTIGATFSGGGFSLPGAWWILLLGIPFFLPLTFMMSTYDGTLGALGIVTIWFLLLGIRSLWRRTAPQQAPPRT